MTMILYIRGSWSWRELAIVVEWTPSCHSHVECNSSESDISAESRRSDSLPEFRLCYLPTCQMQWRL